MQIICAIIPGLSIPVKPSWKVFIESVLLPLHTSPRLTKFWEHLAQCCVNYVATDIEGAKAVIMGLLKYWPKISPQKEEIFVMELVNIINVLLTHHEKIFKYDDWKPELVYANI